MGHAATIVKGGRRVVVLKLGQTITHFWALTAKWQVVLRSLSIVMHHLPYPLEVD
jgi:hypothetical protein